jgi:FtsH-binding integral membrane protein
MKKELYNNFIKNLDKQKFFLVKVFLNLIFQVFIAYIVLLYAEYKELIYTKMHFIIIVLLLFILIFIMSLISSPFIKFILFCIFSSLVGLLMSYKIDFKNEEELEVAKKGFITTGIIFIYMILFGFFIVYMGIEIPYQVSFILFFSLLIMIIVIFILQINGKYPLYRKIISGILIFLFSIFIVYDTYNILNRNYDDDFVSASLDYFLDIINIFVNLNN